MPVIRDDGPEGSSFHSVPCGAAGYPARLLGLSHPPETLWWAGRLPGSERPALAIVGSRAATGAACERARQWAAGLAREGWAVISGGALGIDAAAHVGALEVGGDTYAVLGCGVDVVYPDRHATLFARIVGAGGGLLSELSPGEPPRARQFPSRNRIIAALADAVLVVEAAARSGALITARRARACGQRVLAVPGSDGTDELIAKGAAAVISLGELRDVLAGRALPPPAPVPERQAALITALRAGPDTPGGLASRLGVSLPRIMGLLTEAELDGRVRRAGGSHYEVRGGH
jgi:DNA processing protein